MKKRLISVCLVLAVILAWTTSALGTEEMAVAVTLNGYALELEALARNGTTMVPVEQFLRALGGPVVTSYWDSEALPGGMLYRWGEDGGQALSVHWYDKALTLTPGEGGAELWDGVLWAPLRPLAEALGVTVEWTGRVELSYPKRHVEVDSLKDLFLSIAPDTEIILKPGEYSFVDLDPKALEDIDSPYFYVDYDLFDPSVGEWGGGTIYQMVIRDVRDLTILADGCRISTPWAYADVWHFENCRRVTLEGCTAVHDVEPGYCIGNCAELNDCQDMVLNQVVLDGSGAYGLYADGCRGILLKNSDITHCTYGAAALFDCRDTRIEAVHIDSCEGVFQLFSLTQCTGVQVTGCLIKDNSAGALASYADSREVVFDNCTFAGNQFGAVSDFGWQGSGGAVFVNCAPPADRLQTFLEARGLVGLLSEDLEMTQENRENVFQYFQILPEPEQTYLTLLLGQIVTGAPTPADDYCDPANGVYLTACRSCLYDMDQDGAPEFLLESGNSEADRRYTVYTITDGELVECGGLSGGHAALYVDGLGGLARTAGQMGVYEFTVSMLEGTKLVTKNIATDQVDFSQGEDYPDLRDYGYGAYDQPLEFSELPPLFLAPKG